MKNYMFLITLLTAIIAYTTSANSTDVFPADKMCALIYYDEVKDKNYELGKIYSIQLRNLLGHFPEIQQIVSPIEKYKKGDLDKCRSAFYIGSYFENNIPKDFMSDYISTETKVAWLGYNIWLMPHQDQKRALGYTFDSLTTADYNSIAADGYPSFYRFFKYKGETFKKFADWSKSQENKTLIASYELTKMTKSSPRYSENAKVISTAVHSLTEDEIPYIIQNNNKFYVADVPFSFIHESDRYLIFCDLLFDILDLPPRQKIKPAVLRIEDIHPMTDLNTLYEMNEVLVENQVPINISLIPIFYDPLSECFKNSKDLYVEMTDHDDFMDWIEDSKSKNAFFIWHGVTHQLGEIRNPHSGCSGSDFEFWDMVNNAPVAEDSSAYLIDRLNTGATILANADIYPKVWLTPHYQASPLNYRIFAKVFDWNIGRVIYFNDSPNMDLSIIDTSRLIYSKKENLNSPVRNEVFNTFGTVSNNNWVGQIFPYEIYNDVYDQKVIPESLGNPQTLVSEHVIYPRSIDEILEDARRNLVLRDNWASVFIHPHLIQASAPAGLGEYKGDLRPLEKLVQGIKNLGYQFIDLNEFVESTKTIKTKKAIEL
jgi:uncharacterized protein YdaL